MRTWLDVSNYDASTFAPTCFLDHGIEGVIIGGQRPALADEMASKARAAGLPVRGFYAFLYFGWDWLNQTDAACQLTLRHGVRRVWLDCESSPAGANPTEPPGVTPAQRLAQLRQCVAHVESLGLSAGIYTAGWWWPGMMSGSVEFRHLPLWHAAYGLEGWPAGPVRTVSYGGWSQVAIHQYTSRVELCGRERDHNYVFVDPDEEDEMAPEERKRLERVERLLGGYGIEVDGRRITGEEALALADERDWSAFLGIGQVRQGLAELALMVGRGDTLDAARIAAKFREVADEFDSGKPPATGEGG
jgi:hypothetical protein